MLSLGTFAFTQPWLLLAGLTLPAIWLLLRVTPPAPRRIAFPPFLLLAQLVSPERTPARTPWWLLLLRLLIAALLIFALAGPVLNPAPRLGGSGPLLLVVDNGWAAARHWSARLDVESCCRAGSSPAGRPEVVAGLARWSVRSRGLPPDRAVNALLGGLGGVFPARPLSQAV